MKRLVWTLILPLTVISFSAFTKWWYVLPVDTPDTMMSGFPLPYVCDGWHTSLSLQIFFIELCIDLVTYFAFWFIVIFIINRIISKIKINKIVTLLLLSISGILTAGLILIAANSTNLYYLKRPFDIEVLTTGYKFIWEGNPRPDNFDFDKYEQNKKHIK